MGTSGAADARHWALEWKNQLGRDHEHSPYSDSFGCTNYRLLYVSHATPAANCNASPPNANRNAGAPDANRNTGVPDNL
jgi:hypothetical protein